MGDSKADPIVLSGCGWVTPWAHGSIAEVLTAARHGGLLGHESGPFAVVDDSIRSNVTNPSTELVREKCAWLPALALERAGREAGLTPSTAPSERMGLVLGCGLAGQLGMIEFAGEVRAQGTRFVSPLHFPQTVGNYAAGALARAYKLRGTNITLAAGPASSLNAIVEARAMLAAGDIDLAFAGGFEEWTPELARAVMDASPRAPRPAEGACLFVLERCSAAAARGVKPLAIVESGAALSDSDPASSTKAQDPSDPAARLVFFSTAGAPRAGALFVEQWIGNCPGAAGAAAVAAAWGAAQGFAVPMCPGSADSVEGHIDPRFKSAAGAVIQAQADDGQVVSVALSFDSRP